MNRYSPMAAALFVIALLLPYMLPQTIGVASADDRVVLCPEGGRLTALSPAGEPLGPCALKHTDVSVEVTGLFSRVTISQRFHNPFKDKIEAVYTFPMSHRAAVDRMTMTIGQRVVVGEVHERNEARRIYEAARESGRIASLLEQERPNIFTQSVANIEPGAEIVVNISYIEQIDSKDGLFSLSFPTVVEPRYIPGAPTASEAAAVPPPTTLPEGGVRRDGLVLLAPAGIADLQMCDGPQRPAFGAPALDAALRTAVPMQPRGTVAGMWGVFRVTYADGSSEQGALCNDGTGHIAGRWFYLNPDSLISPSSAPASSRNLPDGAPPAGEPFAQNTNQVPDAQRISPTPARPGTRAGHDISIRVSIDTGGPGIVGLASDLHQIVRADSAVNPDGRARRTAVSLASATEIPNRDFVLSWRLTDDSVCESVSTHAGDRGGFFNISLLPPRRADDTPAVPRELIFVLDTSGSMSGWPIDTAKSVMTKAMASMRPADAFNVITFAGSTSILWPDPRPATPDNIKQAISLVESKGGAGGTEMMTAIDAALNQKRRPDAPIAALSVSQLANMPADGRTVSIDVPFDQFQNLTATPDERACNYAIAATATSPRIPVRARNMLGSIASPTLRLTGAWITERGDRLFDLSAISAGAPPSVRPLRVVMFLTDGMVGNDMAIIDAVRNYRGTTRVFSFGIGNSVNRYLLDSVALAGGGESEYVLIPNDTSETAKVHADIVDRFTRRTQTPVLTDISVTFDPVLNVVDTLTGDGRTLDNIPDLFDAKPVSILGRYNGPASGNVTVRGMTAAGPWSRTIALSLPPSEPAHDSLGSLWARARIENLMNQDLQGVQMGTPAPAIKNQIVALGESFGVLSQYTSFVAVDKLRVTVAGQPRLVRIPIELPDKVSWEGLFGPGSTGDDHDRMAVRYFGLQESAEGARPDAPEIDLSAVLQQAGTGGGQAQSPFRDEATALTSMPPPGNPVVGAVIAPAARPEAVTRAPEGKPSAPAATTSAAGVPVEKSEAYRFEGGVALKEQLMPELRRSAAFAGESKRGFVSDSENERVLSVDPSPAEALGKVLFFDSAGRQADVFTVDLGLVVAGQPAVPADPPVSGASDELRASAESLQERAVRAEPAAETARLRKAVEELGAYKKFVPRQAANEQPAARSVPPSLIIIAALDLEIGNDHDGALSLARSLAGAAPAYAPGVSLAEALDRKDWPTPEARAALLAEIRATAQSELDRIERAIALLNRLDEPLLAVVAALRSHPTSTSQAPPDAPGAAVTDAPLTGSNTPGMPLDDADKAMGPFLVSILVSSVDNSVVDALKSAGLDPIHTDKDSRVVVGWLDAAEIEPAALVDGVLRIANAD